VEVNNGRESNGLHKGVQDSGARADRVRHADGAGREGERHLPGLCRSLEAGIQGQPEKAFPCINE
jgi:hypothetical protein